MKQSASNKGEYLHQRNKATLGSIRELIFGLEDGMVSTLGVVVGIAAGTQSTAAVILAGCIVVAVEALSMAAGDYLSNKTASQLEDKFISEEADEIRLRPIHEMNEARSILRRQGYSAQEQQTVLNRLGRSKRRMLDFMAHYELGISLLRHRPSVLISTAVMGGAYVFGGFVALAAYFFMPTALASVCAVVVVALSLFGLGAAKGKLLSVSWLRSGIEMAGVSLGAAGIGHVVGWFVRQLIV